MQQLDRQCEKFMGGPTEPFGERIHVTINHKGTIFLNRKAHAMMGRPLSVYLYYNRPKDMIILEPTQAVTAMNAFSLKDGKKQAGRRVAANPFCRHFGIRPEGTLKFIAPEADAVGRMYLKLSETTIVTRGRRRKRVNS
jgi:hypothetical protein